MAIDLDVLAKQRIGSSVERRCMRCGQRTRDRSGTCGRCHKGSIPNLRWLSTEHLKAVLMQCREELERRRAEIDEAIGSKP